MSGAVLDASALLALLKLEPGCEVVEAAILDAMISAVNLGEAAQRQFKAGWTRAQFEQTADALGMLIVPVDAELALDAADMREIGRVAGLSQADCICLALARREGAVAMTADRAWREVAAVVEVEVRIIR